MKLITEAIRWWLKDNCPNGKLRKPLNIFLNQSFEYVNSIYSVISQNPLPKFDKDLNSEFGGKGTYIFSIYISPQHFFNLRGIISLIGNDLFYIVNKIMKISKKMQNKSLYKIIRKDFNLFMEYRAVRNFFVHMDERLDDPNTHGIDYEYEIPELKVKFKKSSENIFYLLYGKEHVYFHDKQKDEWVSTPKKVSFGVNKMNIFFDFFRKIYTLLITHTSHEDEKNYLKPETLFVLN